jgi:hypothetical protein
MELLRYLIFFNTAIYNPSYHYLYTLISLENQLFSTQETLVKVIKNRLRIDQSIHNRLILSI